MAVLPPTAADLVGRFPTFAAVAPPPLPPPQAPAAKPGAPPRAASLERARRPVTGADAGNLLTETTYGRRFLALLRANQPAVLVP